MKSGKISHFLDTLNDQELNALQIAALLGDHFSLDSVLDLVDIKPSKLINLLDKMLSQDLIQNQSNSIKGLYVFTQEELPTRIVNSMDEDRRKLYLSDIINYLERKLPNDDKKQMTLADLYMNIGKNNDSFQYMKKAADLLVQGHKTEQALALYKSIIDKLLVRDRDTLESLLLIDSVNSYAPIAINIHSPKDILPVINKAISLAVELKNKRAEAMLEICLGRLIQRQGKSLEASSHYDKGWYLAQEIGDEDLLKIASKLFALSLFWQGRITEAIQIYEGTLGNIEEISPELRDIWAYLMLAWCYGISGRIGRGIGLAEAIRERAILTGHRKTQGIAHGVIALILLEVGRLQEAEPHVDKALEIGEETDSDFALYMAKPCKGYLEYSRGNLKGARELFQEGLSRLKSTSPIHYPCPWFIEVIWTLHKVKWNPVKGYSFTSEINRLMEWPDIYMRGAALRYYVGSMKASEDNFDERERLLKESHKLLEEAGAPIELGRTQIELAKLYVEKQDEKRAKDFAEVAYETLSEIDESLFPSQLACLIPQKSKEFRKDHGISELQNAIRYLPDFVKYVGRVVTILTDMFGAERAGILLKRKEHSIETLDIIASRNFTPEELEQYRQKDLQSLFLNIIKKGEPVLVSDRKKSSVLRQLAQKGVGIRSLTIIPLILGDDVNGMIYMDNRLLEGIFSKKDVIILRAISTALSIAMKSSDFETKIDHGIVASTATTTDVSETSELEPSFPNIIGKSKAIKTVLFNTRKVATTDTTVLITGKTGVGKELIARAIHNLSKRHNKPFIIVNISALTDTLMPSELFGYEKGAFTGALKAKPGRFEAANGGTIFLDEIGDLSMDAQVKLLRVLQEGEFERVGSNQTINSDFRLIAATNKDLSQLVATGEFRSDLFYRIASFPVEIPPLRERREDIPLLALHFMKKYAKINQKNLNTITPVEMERLQNYSWIGNIRELEHVIERAVILSEGENLNIPDLEPNFRAIPENDGREDLDSLDDIQRRHIIGVLNQTKWRIRGENGAAKILGLKPNTLDYRIKKLGIKR